VTHIRAALYRLGCKVHWLPRERAIRRTLDGLTAWMTVDPRRVVDVGCGPGLLAPTAVSRGFAYLGVEPDPAFIAVGQRRYRDAGATFCRATVTTMDVKLGPADIVVVNGVAHHLKDQEMDRLLCVSRDAGALVICDHHRQPGELGIMASALQAADRGRFIRDFSYFQRLAGFELRAAELFRIDMLGMPLWPYFCAAYTPREKQS
jgi:SAM-dependent methyltransferase